MICSLNTKDIIGCKDDKTPFTEKEVGKKLLTCFRNNQIKPNTVIHEDKYHIFHNTQKQNEHETGNFNINNSYSKKLLGFKLKFSPY